MGTSKRIQQAGLVAILGSTLGIVLSLLLISTYHLAPDAMTESAAPWKPALTNVAKPLFRIFISRSCIDGFVAV